MRNYAKEIDELEKHFLADCYIDDWRGITHSRSSDIPYDIRKLHGKFIYLMNIPKPLSVEEQKTIVKRMKKICRKITCYYNIFRIKYFFTKPK